MKNKIERPTASPGLNFHRTGPRVLHLFTFMMMMVVVVVVLLGSPEVLQSLFSMWPDYTCVFCISEQAPGFTGCSTEGFLCEFATTNDSGEPMMEESISLYSKIPVQLA
jgi:hypothetical protein